MMKEATYVIGQSDYTASETFLDDKTTPYPAGSFVTDDGKFLSANRRRILIWNQVPGSSNVQADVVVGQPDFISDNSFIGPSSIYSSAYSVAVSNDGKLLVADSRGILIWNTIPTENGTAADVIIGQDDFFSSEYGASSNRFDWEKFIAITPDNKLIVCDRYNHRVLIYNQIPTENNADADVVIGQDDFTSRIYGTAANRLFYPYGVSVSVDGKLFIADSENHRVLVFNSVPSTSGSAADYVLGQSSMTSRSYGTSSTSMYYPASVSVSRSGKLAIADRYNHRVLIYNDTPLDGSTEPDYVLGQPNFDSKLINNAGLSGRSLSYPTGVHWDKSENLYVADNNNSRYLVWGLPDFTPPLDFTTGMVYTVGGTIAQGYFNASNTALEVEIPLDMLFIGLEERDGPVRKGMPFLWPVKTLYWVFLPLNLI